MGILNIAPASRHGMRFLISLYGVSESGKTLSALLLAAGMEPDPRKRLLLDTEGGQRGRAYVDEVPGGYLYASLTPPFTPERYLEAVKEIEAAGVNVCVIDSFSHVWIAQGGVLDMVEEDTATKNGIAKWSKPKRRHYKLVRSILATDMHVILCSRARQTLVEEADERGKTKLVPGPVVPYQEKNLRFDMTVMAQMLGRGHYTVQGDGKEGGKCPGPLLSIFDGKGVMNQAMGKRLIEWLGQQDHQSGELRILRERGEEAASQGSAAFLAWWNSPEIKPHRNALRTNIGNFESIARQADEDRQRKDEEEGDRASLDNPFGLPPIAAEQKKPSDRQATAAIPVRGADGQIVRAAADKSAWTDAYIDLAKACRGDAEVEALIDHNREVLADLDEGNADRVSNAMKLLRGGSVLMSSTIGREGSTSIGVQ